jgi:hypothetical protein
MNWLKIDGKKWDIKVLGISENFNILYAEGTGRTLAEGSPMVQIPLGTFYGHKITVAPNKANLAEFDRLFNYIAIPRSEGMDVEAVHDQKTMKYKAYVSSGERKVKRIKEDIYGDIQATYYEAFDINFIPIKAQVIPE